MKRILVLIASVTLVGGVMASASASPPPLPGMMYATGDYGLTLVAVDLSSGATTTIGAFGTENTWGTAFTPDGTLWAATGSGIATVDLTTGAATVIGSGVPAMTLEADAAGNLYAGGGGNLFSVDKSTGLRTLIGNMGFDDVMDFAFDSQGKLWAVNGFDPGSFNLYSVDPTTGASQFEVRLPDMVMSLAIDANDDFYISEFVDSPRLFRLDPQTGQTTLIGPIGTKGIHGGDIFAFSPGNGVDKTEYTRTECVYPTGPPDQRESGNPPVLHIRNFPYLGILTHDSGPVGSNSGLVDIDLNLKSGSGSIRGTLTINDPVMGSFEGRFSGQYHDGVWQGRGSAKGIGVDAGKLLKVRLQGLDPGDCEPGAVDAAHWDIVIIDPGH